MPPHLLGWGSVVFLPPDHAAALNKQFQWWNYVPGGNWRHSEGPRLRHGERDGPSCRALRFRRRRSRLQVGWQAAAPRKLNSDLPHGAGSIADGTPGVDEFCPGNQRNRIDQYCSRYIAGGRGKENSTPERVTPFSLRAMFR
jgi:hypothetical protein